MHRGFDHMIATVQDVETAAADFASLGLHVIRRPDAKETETNNRFICFADGSYLQLCSFHDLKASAAHKWAKMLALGEGWVDYSIDTQDIEADAANLKAAGAPFDGPKESQKALADGRVWALAVMQSGRGVNASPAIPFFVTDRADRAIRVPPPPGPQAGNATGVVGVTVLTTGLAAILPTLTALFGPGEDAPLRIAGAAKARLFGLEQAWIEIVEVAGSDSDAGAHLKTRGEGVYEVALGQAGKTRPGDGDLLPLDKTHGARLRLHSND